MATFDTVLCDGMPLPRELGDNTASLKARASRDDDILLVAYPKSGTHWVWEILNMMVAGKVQYAEHWVNSTMIEYRTEEEIDQLESPRILTAHVYPSMLPDSVWKKKVKVIYVQRDTKDVSVSFFSQLTNQVNVWQEGKGDKPYFSGSWAEYFEAYIQGTVPYGSWFEFAKRWETASETSPDAPVLRLYFEDLKRIKKIAEYLGRPLSVQLYNDISDACSFQKLKNVSEQTKNQTFHVKWKEGSTGYFRKGTVGDWKTRYTVAQNELFDQLYEETLDRKYHSSNEAV